MPDMTRSPEPPPYDTVVFDCDSTLSSIEGIEELCAGHPEIERLTADAMEGRVPLEDVFGERLRIANPTRAKVARIGERYRATVAPNANALVGALIALGKRVVVVSGGLRPAVLELARDLGIGEQDVFAVEIEFEDDGSWAGYDERSPLARSGGKLEVVGEFAKSGAVALVGDGMTDLEALPVVARFVAFAAIEERESVVAGADAVVRTFDFAALAPLLLSAEESERLHAEFGEQFAAITGGVPR